MTIRVVFFQSVGQPPIDRHAQFRRNGAENGVSHQFWPSALPETVTDTVFDMKHRYISTNRGYKERTDHVKNFAR